MVAFFEVRSRGRIRTDRCGIRQRPLLYRYFSFHNAWMRSAIFASAAFCVSGS